MATIPYTPSWQQQMQSFGQPAAMNGSIMAGYNPNIANPSSGLTPAFADPMGNLGSGSMGYMSTGDIGKQVASAPWKGMPQSTGSGFGMNNVLESFGQGYGPKDLEAFSQNKPAFGTGPNDSGFGMNIPTFALGLQGLNSLGSLYMGGKSLSLANKQFESAQKFANANLANQTHAYNDTLENKLKRVAAYNGPEAQAAADVEFQRRKLPNRV